MEYLFIIVLILTCLVSVSLLFVTNYNRISEIQNKMNIAQNSIEELLQKKYQLMVECYKFIKKHIKKKDYLVEFNELKVDKLSSYELDEELNNYFETMMEIKDSYKSLGTKDYRKLLTDVNEVNEKIVANKRFFNKYNNVLIKELNGITKIVANFTNIKVKTSYDIKEPIED